MSDEKFDLPFKFKYSNLKTLKKPTTLQFNTFKPKTMAFLTSFIIHFIKISSTNFQSE